MTMLYKNAWKSSKETSSFKNYINGIINTFASPILKFLKNIHTSVAGYV
jgi:hypothetical protein